MARTFADASRAAADALTSYEEAQARTKSAQIGLVEVIMISDDEVDAGPSVESGGPATRVSPMPGSGDDSQSRTLVIEVQGPGSRTEVTVAFTPDGVQVIREFLAAVMVVPCETADVLSNQFQNPTLSELRHKRRAAH